MVDVFLEFVDVIGQVCDVVFVLILVFGGQVVEYEVQMVGFELFGEFFFCIWVWEQEFDGVEVCVCGCFEVVEEWYFVEQYGQVCSKFWYELSFFGWLVKKVLQVS